MLVTLNLSGCATGRGVVEVHPCIEIPFKDGPEGACTNTVNHQAYLVPHDKWIKLRPTMIMLRASDWTKIKRDWLKGCRMLTQNDKKCNVAVDSIDRAVRQLSSIANAIDKI